MTLTWFCPDVDAAFARAVALGAVPVSEATDSFHGDRNGTLRCPFGHRWILATHCVTWTRPSNSARSRQVIGG